MCHVRLQLCSISGNKDVQACQILRPNFDSLIFFGHQNNKLYLINIIKHVKIDLNEFLLTMN